jgi:hypothetical protein
MRDTDGLLGSVRAAALKFEAVTLPARWLNQVPDFAWFLVEISTSFACKVKRDDTELVTILRL